MKRGRAPGTLLKVLMFWASNKKEDLLRDQREKGER